MANTEGPQSTALASYILDPLIFIANVIFEVENHGFHGGKPFPTCTSLFLGHFVFPS